MNRRATLDPLSRAAVSTLILTAKGSDCTWTYESIAEAASSSLLERSKAPGVSEEERNLWGSFEVTVSQVRTLLNCPRNPTGDPVRRAALLGVCLALDVDLAAMNRVAGGIG